MDVEGCLVWRKKNSFSKRKWREIMSLNSILKIKKVLSKESCHGGRVKMCCSLNYYQHFPCQMMGILRHKYWNKSFKEKLAHMLIFKEGYMEEEIATVQNLWHFKIWMFVKPLNTKSWGFLGQLTWVTSRKAKEGVGFYHIEIRGVKNNNDISQIKHSVFDWAMCWYDGKSNEKNRRWETRCSFFFSEYLKDNAGA